MKPRNEIRHFLFTYQLLLPGSNDLICQLRPRLAGCPHNTGIVHSGTDDAIQCTVCVELAVLCLILSGQMAYEELQLHPGPLGHPVCRYKLRYPDCGPGYSHQLTLSP